MKLDSYMLSKKLILSMLCLLFAFTTAFAQVKVMGTVTDAESGEGLIGANIVIKGTASGTITDFDGNYELTVEPGSVLVFSYTGYTNQEVTITDQTRVDMALSSGELLEEIVVIGYGTVKKSDLTGSVASVKAEDFNGGIVTAPDQLVQGKVAGVQILSNSGQPGSESTVRIRGNSSVRAGNRPLYVVDGVPLDGRSARPGVNVLGSGDTPSTNPLNFLNPNDIESMEVLKDASAAAIYGSRGSNGVVIITTKKGKSGDPTIDFGVSTGFSSILKKLEVLDAGQYRDALNEYGLTTGDDGASVDAMDEILRTGITQNYNFSIGGGTENGNYRISASYLDQKGIIDESQLKKYNASLQGSYKFLESKRLKLDFNLIASNVDENVAPVTSNADFTGNVIGQALQWNPTTPLYNTDGSINVLKGSTTINPVAYIEAFDDRVNMTSVLASISPSYKITDNLVYKYLFSVNHNVGSRRTQTKSWINVQNVEDRGWANSAENTLTSQQHTHTLSYNTDINSNLSLGALAGYEYQKFDNRGFNISGRDFVSDDIDYTATLDNTTNTSREAGSFADPISELQSFFGRVNLNLNEKYLLTATVRADGSSKFGENNRYGTFPSVALAWRMSEEDFVPEVFDNLKLRLGWGQTGNQEFPAGSAQERYELGGNGSLSQENVANPDLKWETSTTLNAGVDFSIFNYKLSGTIDYFKKTTEDLLFNFQAIQPAPATRYWINLPGQVVNSGVELSLNSFLINNSNVNWNLGANVAFLNNELQDYVGPTVLAGQLFGQGISNATSQELANEQPLNAFKLREWLGLDESGFDQFTDDGNTTYFLGDPNPDILLGISSDLTVGDFSFSLNFTGAFGHQIYNNTANSVLPIGNLGSRNIAASLLEGGQTEALANAITPSSRYMEDGDYVKLSNASIGYNIGSIGNVVKNARVYITGQNLFVLTDYSGFDPEVNTVNERDGVPSFGIEYTPYPSARNIILGVNFSF